MFFISCFQCIEVENRYFFEYNKELDGFLPINEPIEFKHDSNFAVG